MDFSVFKNAIARQFERMKKNALYRTGAEKDRMWATYLGGFPPGSDPVYKVRTEHDCNCCKQFVRAAGNVVAIIDGKIESIWDVEMKGQPEYQAVADAMSTYVKSLPIADLFYHFERVAGTDKSFQDVIEGIKTWGHFFVNVPTECVLAGKDIASTLAEPRMTAGVLLRGLTELSEDAFDTVLDMISQNSLYRGAEKKFDVSEFLKLKKQFDKIPKTEDGSLTSAHDAFVWTHVKKSPQSVTRINNSLVGELLKDITNDEDLEVAVKKFEKASGGENYKRPQGLASPAQLKKAGQTVESLGLTSALLRRNANLGDITINNVLFANRDARKNMNASIFEELADQAAAKKPKELGKVEEVSIDRFISEILPRVDSIEVLFENRHVPNLVSLIAPVDPTCGDLFKWPNKFSWSYNGDVADSIKERVKAAGGSVEGDLCCRLAWEYRDDLDFHMLEPGGHRIYFSNRRQMSPCGGMLDLDANGADGQRDDPAENIFYKDRKKMKEGTYTLLVNNYSRRSDGVGFEVEIEFDGTAHHIGYEKALKSGETIEVAKIRYSKIDGFEIISSLPSSQTSKNTWGVGTQTFQKVSAMMLSPNFWDGLEIGNKHFFFMLENCANDGQARGFYNEFLKSELDPHRKALEMVGRKMKTAETPDQLSGLGFSSTQRNEIVCRVSGSFTRTLKILF